MSPLAPTYVAARARFRAAAESAGATLSSTTHPRPGLEGEDLTVDVARLGRPSAPTKLLVVSGTHGVEGYCGSALQERMLAALAAGATPVHDDTEILMIHALNPFGFSWVRRTNENNVDLNRNFLDWSLTPPANPDYDAVAERLVPDDASPDALPTALVSLLEWLDEVGLEFAQQVVSSGQYDWPTGVFHGGTGPEWSNTWLRTFLAEAVAPAERVVVVDLHTGLGERGSGELITSYRTDSDDYERATGCWGRVTSMLEGESVSAQLWGDWLDIIDEVLPESEVIAAALEFGTVDPVTVVLALRADAWLHAHAAPNGPFDLHGPLAESTRAQVRAAFAEDSEDWFAMVAERFDTVIEQALVHLVAPAAVIPER